MRIFYWSNENYFYQLYFRRNQCSISGDLSGIGRWHGIACGFAAQTACHYITAGRYFLHIGQKRTDGRFLNLVGISDNRDCCMPGGICIFKENPEE